MTKKQAEEKLEELKSIMEKNGVSIPIELVDGDIPEELLQPKPELPEEIKAIKERLKKASPISYGYTVSEEKSKDEGPKLVDVNDLSDDEGLAIEYYSRGAFDTSFIVNEFLRNNRKSSGLFDSIDTEEYKETVIKSKNELNSIVDNLNNAIYKYGLIEEPITTYRGQTNYSGRDLDQLQVGDIFSEPGFSSTSLDRDISLDFMGPSNGVLFKINIPKGSYGLRISDDVHRVFHEGYKDADRKFYSKNNMEEKEILLPSGTQYKIKSINLVGENYEIEVDVVPQEKKIVKPKGPVKEVKVKKIKPSRLATKEELDNLFKKAEDPRVSPETKSVIEELSNKKETIDRATVKDVLEMIKEDIEFKKLLEELKDSEPPKSDVPFSTDDVVKDYINSDDGTYFRVGDTIKRKNSATGEVEEIKIESENDAFASGATLSYFGNREKAFFNILKSLNEEQVIDFIQDWNKRNPNRRVYVDPFRLKFKISKNAKKLNMDPVDESSWVDATYNAVLQYAEYENLKAFTDAFIEFEEKFPGVSKFAERAAKDREGVRIFAEDIKDSKVVVAVSSAFFRTILEDGRLKTQFETNFSKGIYDPTRRSIKELSTFGVPLDTNPKNRPIYAYLTLPDNPERDKYASNPQNFTIASKAVNQYGDLRFVLKDSAKKKTTFTMQDSLGSSMRNGGKLSDDVDENTILEAGFLRNPNGEDFPLETTYIEAQIHNGVSLNDVEKIVIPYSSSPDRTWYSNMTKEQAEQLMEQYKSLMEKKGISIPIELVDGDLAGNSLEPKPEPEIPEEPTSKSDYSDYKPFESGGLFEEQSNKVEKSPTKKPESLSEYEVSFEERLKEIKSKYAKFKEKYGQETYDQLIEEEKQILAESKEYFKGNIRLLMAKNSGPLTDEEILLALDSAQKAFDRVPNKFKKPGDEYKINFIGRSLEERGEPMAVTLTGEFVTLISKKYTPLMMSKTFAPDDSFAYSGKDKYDIQLDVTLNHELGHSITDVSTPEKKAEFLSHWENMPAEAKQFLGGYGFSSEFEGYAEAYAQWVAGEDNALTRYYDKMFGWSK